MRSFIAKLEQEAYTERDEREGSPRKILGLSDTAAKPDSIGEWFYTQIEHEERDYNYYSKRWHNRHGPKITTTRGVKFARMYRGEEMIVQVELKTWAGDWLHKAAKEAGILKPVKSKLPLRIRLKAEYDAKLDSTRRGYKIYSRTLLGTHIDWVIESPMGMTFHSTDRKALVRGLFEKGKAAVSKLAALDGEKISWTACKKLGFCDAGINAFCDDFGLDTKLSYTPEQIKNAIRQHPERVTPYTSELRTLAAAYNTTYSI